MNEITHAFLLFSNYYLFNEIEVKILYYTLSYLNRQ